MEITPKLTYKVFLFDCVDNFRLNKNILLVQHRRSKTSVVNSLKLPALKTCAAVKAYFCGKTSARPGTG